MLANSDAGSVVAAAQSGVQWGYRLAPLLLALFPVLYMVQELTVRLGIYTQKGHGELIRERFGPTWAYLSVVGLVVATTGTLVTEFTAVAGIGELYGVSRLISLPLSAAALIGIVTTGSYRRVERVAVIIGLFELAFFYVAWRSQPDLATIRQHVSDLPWRDHGFLFLAAALIGTVFNPWMIFYQQSAIAEKRLEARDLPTARGETAIGALLTQCLTISVLVAVAATLGGHRSTVSLKSVGDISAMLTPYLGVKFGRLVFGVGVLGAATVAAVVASLAMAWGLGEVLGYQRSLEFKPGRSPWFYGGYVASVLTASVIVCISHDLVLVNIGAQVVNALFLPFVLGLLAALAADALPEEKRLKGFYFWLLLIGAAATAFLGVYGGLSSLF
ncbi:NRAMP family divalent metal transporter [Pararobbsia silviterrae]|nr:divalent metal cation transporter [Pararobbsia silviterrae]